MNLIYSSASPVYFLQVNLGVLFKNEQYTAEMVDIIEYAHKFTVKEEQLKTVLFEGDYLTFEQAKTAQSAKQNSLTPSQRLEGLIMKAAEFHNQSELLKVIYIYGFYMVVSDHGPQIHL